MEGIIADKNTSPLLLAYIGDSVYSLMVRQRALKSRDKLNNIHLKVTALVRASAQAKALEIIKPLLTLEEEDIIRRGRNASSRHAHPKSSSIMEYKASTAFETLIGHLYLSGETERLNKLFDVVINNFWGEICQEQT